MNRPTKLKKLSVDAEYGEWNWLMIVFCLHFRVCMVAKPLATCAMAWMKTCVVVDSGAFSTSVSVVLNGQVVQERWKHIPVGGWHVAEYLKQAMQWQPGEYTEVGYEQTVVFFFLGVG
jgi:actin-related protein